MSILICDDEKEIVEALELYLKNEGYAILKAYTGREAIALVEKEEVQLIIMDVMMPEMDGLRATMKIRETNTRTGESHVYDTEDRKREIKENHKNKIIGYHSPFRDVQNGDIITYSPDP